MHAGFSRSRYIFAPRGAFLRLAASLAAVMLVFACAKSSPQPSPLADQDVTVTGVNYCVSCELGKRGATTRCDFYGHHHSLRVESAVDGQGKAVPEVVGDTLHYLDNDESAALVDFDDFHDKRVRISGRLYAREHTIAVKSVDAL